MTFVWIAALQTAVLKWMNTRSFTYNCSSYIDSFTQNKPYLYEEFTTGENSSKTETCSKTFRKCHDSKTLHRGIRAMQYSTLSLDFFLMRTSSTNCASDMYMSFGALTSKSSVQWQNVNTQTSMNTCIAYLFNPNEL